MGTDMLRILPMLRVSSDGHEHEQGTEDNPNVEAHRWEPLAPPVCFPSGALITPIVASRRRLARPRPLGLLPSPGDATERLLRRDEGALRSRSMSVLLTIFPTNALTRGLV
jgi:hypothetical protein